MVDLRDEGEKLGLTHRQSKKLRSSWFYIPRTRYPKGHPERKFGVR